MGIRPATLAESLETESCLGFFTKATPKLMLQASQEITKLKKEVDMGRVFVAVMVTALITWYILRHI